jgi:hypothetical protein
MWGNLAGRLGATDINATLAKIGNAVAPREDDDDDSEYIDDEDGSDMDYDDDDYEEDEDYGHGDVKGIINKVAGASPFRLAGMLSKALDNRHPEIENMAKSDNNSYTGDKNTASNNILFPRESIRIDEEIVRNGDKKNDAGNDCQVEDTKQTRETLQSADKTVRGLDELPRVNIQQKSDEAQVDPRTKDSPTGIDGSTVEQSAEALPKCIDDLSKVEDVAAEFQKPEEEEIDHTPFHTMATETKLPLIRTEMKTKIASSNMKNDAVKASSVKTDQVSSTNNSLKSSEKIHTDKNNTISQQPLDLKKHQNIPSNFLEVDTPMVTGNKTKEEEEKVDLTNEDRNSANELSSAVSTSVMGNVAVAEGKNRPRVVEKEHNVNATTNIKSKASTPKLTESTVKQAVSPSLDAKKFDDVSKLSSRSSPENTVQSDGGTRNIIKAPSAKSSTLIEKTSHSPSSSDNDTPLHIARSESDIDPPNAKQGIEQKSLEPDFECTELQTQLLVAKREIEALQNQAQRDKEKGQSEREDLLAQFQSKEARLLQATSEENQNQTLLLQQECSAKIQNLEHSLVKERKVSQEEQAEYKKLLRESYSKVDRMESQLGTTVNKYEKEIAQVQQREDRALRKVDDRMAQTMAVLDERDEEIKGLKKTIKNMASKVNEHQEGEEEAEEELEEVHQENDSLRQTVEKLELEKKDLKDQVATLKSGSEELSGLQMELTMLKEERNRERTKKQTVLDSALSSRTQLETERDNALSELKDTKQQLAATLGDLEISRADYSRIIMANDNLQSALEAFQDERRAEIEMIDEQRRESEEAIKSAHATATSALKQIHENEMYEIQKASDNAVKNIMHEMELVEGNFEKLKSENNQMRRSLDEAIHRLQTTQEDVIDRNVMKNILLDWCTLNDKSKRHQVLQVMANLLHFSDDEKEKVHLTSKSLDSVRAKVVGALTAPLPPSKADVEHLEGSNVHEKWVNFLMAETDDN